MFNFLNFLEEMLMLYMELYLLEMFCIRSWVGVNFVMSIFYICVFFFVKFFGLGRVEGGFEDWEVEVVFFDE